MLFAGGMTAAFPRQETDAPKAWISKVRLVRGTVRAESAWGRYWGWDPKEPWALITWLAYTAYRHTRLVRKLPGLHSNG